MYESSHSTTKHWLHILNPGYCFQLSAYFCLSWNLENSLSIPNHELHVLFPGYRSHLQYVIAYRGYFLQFNILWRIVIRENSFRNTQLGASCFESWLNCTSSTYFCLSWFVKAVLASQTHTRPNGCRLGCDSWCKLERATQPADRCPTDVRSLF